MGKLMEEGMKAAGCWQLKAACLALGSESPAVGRSISVTDGPFTESKELVGGFAILKANSKEEAIQLRENFLKVAGEGECELRQLYEQLRGCELRGRSTEREVALKAEHDVIGSCGSYRDTSHD